MATDIRANRVRTIAVAVLAVLQIASSPVTTLILGPSSNTGAISDAFSTPITPAGYAFAIWGLIYAACVALAVYQLLPSQRSREVHRRTGWWLVGAFACSAAWVPIFGTRTIWGSQIVIVALVVCLAVTARRLGDSGAASGPAERGLLRLPVTLYLGWATLATAAGFGLTFRSFGMPAGGSFVTAVCLAVVLLATVISALIVSRFTAAAGFAFTACWALIAVAVATDVDTVRLAVLVSVVLVLGFLVLRAVRSSRPVVALLG